MLDLAIAAALVEFHTECVLVHEIGVERDGVEVAVALLIEGAAKAEIKLGIVTLDSFILADVETVVLIVEIGVSPKAEYERSLDLLTVGVNLT